MTVWIYVDTNRQRCAISRLPGRDLAIERGLLQLHESGTYVRFTQAGAELWA
jgi:hypothetical protein